MKTGGAGLVIIGFVFLWIAISGRLDCFFAFVQCLTTGKAETTTATDSIAPIVNQITNLPKLFNF